MSAPIIDETGQPANNVPVRSNGISRPAGGGAVSSGAATPVRMAQTQGVNVYRRILIAPAKANTAVCLVGGSNPPRFVLTPGTGTYSGNSLPSYELPASGDRTILYDLYDVWIQPTNGGEGVVWEGWS